MKSIKYTLSAILLLCAGYASAQQPYCPPWVPKGSITSECIAVIQTPVNIYTLKGTEVSVLEWVDVDWSSNMKTNILNYYKLQYGNKIDFEAEATVKYNCHAWAWGGGTTYMMTSGTASVYFSYLDESYFPASNAGTASKVWYNNGDHSANTIPSSSYVSSKWGTGPRFKHLVADCPYTGTPIYFGTPSISNINTVCYSASFTLNNPPPHGTIYWTVSNTSLFSVPSSGNPVTVNSLGAYGGSATLQARTDSTSGPIIDSKTISTCAAYINGTKHVNSQATADYYINVIPNATYQWSSENGRMQRISGNGNWATFKAPFVASGGVEYDTITCEITVGGFNFMFYFNVEIRGN